MLAIRNHIRVCRLSFRTVVCLMMLLALSGKAQFEGWKHSGSMFILTTPDGADLGPGVVVKDFPLLVRLHRDFFPFDEAAADGSDIRFSIQGKALAYELEKWDPEAGSASL